MRLPMLQTHQPLQRQQTPRRHSARSILAHFGFQFSASDFRLGSGHYSKVYKGYFKDSQRNFAIKIIDLEHVSAEFKRKFLPRELDIWRQLDHVNHVYLYKDFVWGGYQFEIMELVTGGDMLSYVQKWGPISEMNCHKWMLQLIDALIYLHSKGIAHRDLKLENILISEGGIVKVIDYGFCKQSTNLSLTFCGSRSYSAPEILRGTAYDIFKADVWSLGVTGFIMLTNTMPFREDMNNELIVDSQRRRFYKYPPRMGLKKQCRNAIDALLTFEPTNRPNIFDCANLEWIAQGPATSSSDRRTTAAAFDAMGRVRGR